MICEGARAFDAPGNQDRHVHLAAITARGLTIRIIPTPGKVALLAIIPGKIFAENRVLEGLHNALVFNLSRMGEWL